MKPKTNPLHEAPVCPQGVPRRQFLKTAALGATVLAGGSAYGITLPEPISQTPPRTPTAIAFCKRYHYPTIRKELQTMLQSLGDVPKRVKNKFVTVKTNLVNTPKQDQFSLPVYLTLTAHPDVALALASLLVEYGAKRVTFCDQLPLRVSGEEGFSLYGFDIDEFKRQTDGKVRFANTRNKGEYKEYGVAKVRYGGLLTSAWEVNKTYTDTDVIVSLAKMKSHVSGGVTLGMKNLFGVPPSSMYGDDVENEPDESAVGYRGQTMHSSTRKPLTSTQYFNDKSIEGDHGHNVPQFIVDLNGAFPIELVVIDGICTIQSGEGWWLGNIVSPASPGLLIAGRNPVCTDAVAASVMGFNPEAEHRTHPFPNGLNHLKLAGELGLGDHRVKNLDVLGVSIEKARYGFEPTYQRQPS